MPVVDYRDCPVTGACPAALESFEQALAAFQCWHTGAAAHVERALNEAPDFVMAHALRCWLLLCSREPSSVAVARPLHAAAQALLANERERMHLAAIGAVIDDDYEGACAILDALLAREPRDVLALQVVHALDYLVSDALALHHRVAAVMPMWSSGLPGYHAVLAMLAFGLEETGAWEAAEDTALRALELEPRDARANHVIAHVYEATGRAAAGARWMGERLSRWGAGTTVATHCWWHLALFHLEARRVLHVLALYDRRLRPAQTSSIADLIDASALLWRLQLAGIDAKERWTELALGWAPHLYDGHCTFSDLHAMLAFVGAREWGLAQNLLSDLEQRQAQSTRHGRMTRALGLPACRALAAFGRGDHVAAIEGLAPLTRLFPRLGGSHAQRDVLHLTLREALESVRARRSRSMQAA